MTHEATRHAAHAPLPELDWSEIAAPGCYLHLVSGLLARVFPDELAERRRRPPASRENRVARLSTDPGTPVAALRTLAARHGYPVHF